jgi:hypothetical protein
MVLSSPRNISLIFLGQSRHITDEHKKKFKTKIAYFVCLSSGEPPKQAYIYFSIHINKS